MAAAAISEPWSLELQDAVIGRAEGFRQHIPSLSLQNGAICFVEGQNGSGKTTLLRSIVGLLPFLEGRAHFQTTTPSINPYLWRGATVGLFENFTVRDTVRLQAMMGGVALSPDSLLDILGLARLAHQKCNRLSTGQQARLHLAPLFFAPSPLWVLDEPFRGLDQEGVALFSHQIQSHTQQGGGVIFTSHQGVEITPTHHVRLP